jgi:hypothetical protein
VPVDELINLTMDKAVRSRPAGPVGHVAGNEFSRT